MTNGDAEMKTSGSLTMRAAKAVLPASLALALGIAGLPGQATAQEEVTIASWGGSYQEALRKAFYEPAAKATGVNIKDVTVKSIADVRLQVQAKAVTWDIVELYGGVCEQAKREGLTEPLDYGIIKTDGIDKSVVSDHWIALNSISTLLTWNTGTVKNPPKNWKDFFDVKNFPGGRSLYPASSTVEIALLGDGVPRDKLYPLDLDRAFKKLEQLKPNLTAWWGSGAQATQLALNGEVEYMSMWTSRIEAVQKEGGKIGYTYEDGVMNIDCLIVPKGAPNKKAAMKVIGAIMSPDIQANLPLYVNYSPINKKAFETGKITPALAAQLNTSPENAAKQVMTNVMWWADHAQEIQERFDKLIK